MNKTITYKNHVILLDGITARVYDTTLVDAHLYIYKTRFIDAVEAVKSLKSFINLRVEQQQRDRSINIYA
jgi:hypothetical protein